jgi:hypothetical protein
MKEYVVNIVLWTVGVLEAWYKLEMCSSGPLHSIPTLVSKIA